MLYNKLLHSTTLLLVLLLSVGCGGKVITTKVDPVTGDTVIVEETTSMWKSANLSEFYAFESERARHAGDSATVKINAITQQYMATAPTMTTPVELALLGILTQMQLAAVPTLPPPSGVAAPRVAVDMWSTNLIPLLSVGLQAYQVFGGAWGDSWHQQTSTDSPDIAVTGSGNSVFFKSDNNMNPAYNLSAMGEARNIFSSPGIGGYTIDETHTTTTTEGDSSNGLSLF